MKFDLEVNTEVDSADVVGEALRGKFWKQPYVKTRYGVHRKRGCYESFDYQDDVEELPDEIEKEEGWDEVTWHRAKWRGVSLRWYWDGDGIIEFWFPDGECVRNSDCKKSYGWEWEFTQEEDK